MKSGEIKILNSIKLIKLFNLKHNNKYKYVDIKDHITGEDKITAICPIHGIFSIYVINHLNGKYCKFCTREKQARDMLKKGSHLFLSKIGDIFPDYDFSNFIYTGCLKKSTVICNKHNITFQKTPDSLLANQGCPECIKDKRRLLSNELKTKFDAVHGDTYKYPGLENVTVNDYIDIICPIHGLFNQRVVSHLNGSGCTACYNELRSQKAKKGSDAFYNKNVDVRFRKFLKKALTLHGNRYDYSLVEYINSYTDVCIICPDHGEIQITPYAHLQSSNGCTLCGKDVSYNRVHLYSRKEVGKDAGSFYKLLFTHVPTGIKFVKIGITQYTIEERYKNGYDEFLYEVLDQIIDTNLNCAILEQEYKNINKHNRFIIPKEIEFVGRTETYYWDQEQQLKHNAISVIRDSFLEKQGGVCGICQLPPKRPVLDHSHKKRTKGSGRCRGTVCSNCNVFAGKIENNVTRFGIAQEDLSWAIREMAAYFEASQPPLIHPNEQPKPKILKKSSYNILKSAINGKQKLAVYRTRKRKNVQKLTKALDELYKKYKIEPEFYAE